MLRQCIIRPRFTIVAPPSHGEELGAALPLGLLAVQVEDLRQVAHHRVASSGQELPRVTVTRLAAFRHDLVHGPLLQRIT